MIGLQLNSIHEFGEERRNTVPKEHTFRDIQLATERDYFESKKFLSGKVLEYGVGVLYPEYAKNNIATETVAKSEDVARFHGCTEVGGICSSEYTYKLCVRLGHTCRKKVKVSEFYENLDMNPDHQYFYWVSKSLNDSEL